jgi:hypothetical protein
MIFYIFLGLVVLGALWLFLRSPTVKQLMRGRGSDPAQFGTYRDHLADLGSEPGWNDDGHGGFRGSRRDSPQSRRHDKSY